MRTGLHNSKHTSIGFFQKNSGGFTLVEMIVSISVFIIVLLISTSAFLSVLNADRKSRAVRIATDNLNLSLEDMQRRIKTGASYYCGVDTNPTNTLDCPSGDTAVSFLEQDGQTRTIYEYDATDKAIYRTSYGPVVTLYTHGARIRVTAKEINIDNVKFIVQGSTPGDLTQPYVNILISGSTIGARNTVYNIQSVVAQRNYDS